MEPLTTAHLTFFASLVLLGYSYVGYPVLLWLLGQLHGEETAVQADPAIWPDVSVVIAAHNEEVGHRPSDRKFAGAGLSP